MKEKAGAGIFLANIPHVRAYRLVNAELYLQPPSCPSLGQGSLFGDVLWSLNVPSLKLPQLIFWGDT